MARKRTKSKRSKKQSNKYLSLIVILIAVTGFFAFSDNLSPTGQFTVSGKKYSSYVDYYDQNPTSVENSDFNKCIKITKKDARWPKRNYYTVKYDGGSKKFKYGSKWRPAKAKTKALKKARKYASTKAVVEGVHCWKYGKVVSIGKRGCIKILRDSRSGSRVTFRGGVQPLMDPYNYYEAAGSKWKLSSVGKEDDIDGAYSWSTIVERNDVRCAISATSKLSTGDLYINK